ncbi:hypothetical protein CLAFUW4_07305 [Fulvia fulva]|nr:hypothetical protein CLAFUR4_07312 [Fulvia fulva]WPV16221.1 hypothetical protein CLAFUW4_07305 [Fulvia fulva]
MFSTLSLSNPTSQTDGDRARNKYSRLICLGCQGRRIRCELPTNIEPPASGQLQEAQAPCYRCRRLGIPCVIRQPILGRPSVRSSAASAAHVQRRTTYNDKAFIWIDTAKLPAQSASAQLEPAFAHDPIDSPPGPHNLNDLSLNGHARYTNNGTLLLHKPQSSETFVIIGAIDTICCERVEEEWFRHLPVHYGHTQALDLAVKALVQACAYARGVNRLTSRDCFQALAPVLTAVRANIKQSQGQSSEDMLAATALLAPFEGTVKEDGVPSWLHVKGLAAIMVARSEMHTATQLGRDIFDWYAAESSIMACIKGIPSPFEKVPRAYFVSDTPGCGDSDRVRIKALGNELFIGTPRLVMLVRKLRAQSFPQHELLVSAQRLLQSMLELQDPDVERRLMQDSTIPSSNDSDTITDLALNSLRFASRKDFEALTCYWQSRLSLLRLERCLYKLAVHTAGSDVPSSLLAPSFGPHTDEMRLLARKILMSVVHVPVLPLFRQQHLLAHAMIVVWGAMKDTSLTQGTELTGSLSDLLLRRVNRALNAKPAFCPEDMDQAAEIFVGGERTGRLASLYGM